jgi:peptidoglycan/xylan/chitin deacetylase (PgdA/CDA1 family)
VERRTELRLERNLSLLSDFQSHLRFLRRFRVLTLSELVEVLTSPPKRLKPAVVITFDDGYGNNLLAAEALGANRLPWSVFVSTGSVGPDNPIGAVELSLLLLHGRASRLELLGQNLKLSTSQEREDAFQTIRYALKSMPAEQRRDTMAQIRQQFPAEETRQLLQEFPSLKMLTWEEISQLAAAGVEIGSHGVDHEIHHAEQPETVRRRELLDSKAKLEKHLGRPCRFFAFPNGDFNPASADEVRAAGYDLAFTTQPGTVTPGTIPYLLPRLETPASLQKLINNFFRT